MMKELHNQYIALRKCDSQTNLIRLTKRVVQKPAFGSGPFHSGNGFAYLTPGVTFDNCASIL